MPDIFDQMKDKWPSTILSRPEVGNFSGGAVSPKFLANCDSLKEGPAERFKIGKKTCYPVDSFILWLRARSNKANPA